MSEGRDDTNEERTSPMEPENANGPLPSEGDGKPMTTETELVPPTVSPAYDGLVRLSLPTSQVARTVAVALLSAAVVLGGLFMIWQVRTFIGWLVIALFLAAVLNPAVNWLQRRHRMVKRSLAIILTYLGVVVLLVLIAGGLRTPGHPGASGSDQLHRRRRSGRGPASIPQRCSRPIRAGFSVRQAQFPNLRSTQQTRGFGQKLHFARRSASHWRRRLPRRRRDYTDAYLLHAVGQRALG